MQLKEYQKVIIGALLIFITLGAMSYVWNTTQNVFYTCSLVLFGGIAVFYVVQGEDSKKKKS